MYPHGCQGSHVYHASGLVMRLYILYNCSVRLNESTGTIRVLDYKQNRLPVDHYLATIPDDTYNFLMKH